VFQESAVMSHSAKSVFVAVLAGLLSCGCAQSFAQSGTSKSTVDTVPSNVISDGDMLEIAVFESPDLGW
jgi:hypothetical protein